MQRAAPADAARCIFRTRMIPFPSHPVPFFQATRFSIFRNPPLALSEEFFFSRQHASVSMEILFTRFWRFFLPQRQSASPSPEIRLSRFLRIILFSRQYASAFSEIRFTRFRRILLFPEQSVSFFPEVPSPAFRHRFPKARLRIRDRSEAWFLVWNPVFKNRPWCGSWRQPSASPGRRTHGS